MASRKRFQPDWLSSPGDTIADILDELDLSVNDFAQRIGHSSDAASDLIRGRASITLAVARKLEEVLGASVEFWMSRDFQYHEDIARLRAADDTWINELPLKDMIKFNWITPLPHPGEEETACLRFFDVPTVRAWREEYANLREMVAFRTSPSFHSRPAAVAAWLRQGEIESSAIDCGQWDAGRFEESLESVRPLTWRKEPGAFIPDLQKVCAESGVALAVVRAPTGCRASGATRFLSSDRALLLLSFRYLTDDHFWFTFFHEAGHLLRHGKGGLFLEGDDMPLTTEEREANEFAALTLIPSEFQPSLLALRANTRDVIRFATRLGVSPGIVVGQLQHRERIPHNQLNRLKRRYTWED